VRLRLLFIAIVLYAVIQGAAATVIHIGQRDHVYYNDTIDLRGIAGWSNTLAYWNHDPSQDPPDKFVSLVNGTNCKKVLAGECAIFLVTTDMPGGMWYQWYGSNEKAPVAVFYVIPRDRPVALMPEPTPLSSPVPKPEANPQPAPIADLLIARHDSLSYQINGTTQVWLIGPSLEVMGNRTKEWLNLTGVSLAAGGYSMLIQYPDANGVFEVYNAGSSTIESVWKGVDGFWYGPLGAEPLEDRLWVMFMDTAHFHGNITEKQVIVQEQRTDVTSVDQIRNNSIGVSGFTNLARGENVTAIFDENRSVTSLDRRKATGYGTAVGEVQGAYRLWQATINVDLQKQAAGNHFISVYTPDGSKTVVPFYLSAAFEPFETPTPSVRYIDNSPFIPTPTPVIIERNIPVTVIQTVTVPVTPAYETVLAAQTEAAVAQRKAFEGTILSWVFGSVFLVLGGFITYKGGRYLKDVARRAREK
jgi:hypothetical protein